MIALNRFTYGDHVELRYRDLKSTYVIRGIVQIECLGYIQVDTQLYAKDRIEMIRYI